MQDLIDSSSQRDSKNRPNIEDVYDKVNELKNRIHKMNNDEKIISFCFARMFKGCRYLEKLDLSEVDIHGVFD